MFYQKNPHGKTNVLKDSNMKTALIVYGGWEGHQPKETTGIFIPWLQEQGYETTWTDTLDAFLDQERMKAYHIIIPCWTCGELSSEQEKGLSGAIMGGVGLAGWHGGLCDAFRASPGYQFMTGGQCVAHPGGCVEYSIHITKPDDPIVSGFNDFKMKSEQYYLLADPSNEVLATTTFSGEIFPWIDGCIMPQVWKRMYGQGRVFYSALGHVAADFDVPECIEIMKRGILWASR